MKITVLTLFPEMFSALDASILGRAKSKGLLELEFINIREFAANKHKKTDDYPFGGGAGMVMSCQPIYDAVLACDPEHSCRRVYLSPKGRLLCQPLVQEYAKGQDLLLLCGHYEGVDQRVLDLLFDEELSIGDYVLTGGELPAMCSSTAWRAICPRCCTARSLSRRRAFPPVFWSIRNIPVPRSSWA